jgi:branched-chain amino acid transport system permease protein
MALFLSALVAGIGIGAVYALIALSYTAVFRSTGIFNVAQGDLMMAGVLMSYYCLDVWHVGQAATLLSVLAVVIALSLIEERIAVRPFISRPGHGIGWFISTLAFSLVLENIAANIYGQKPVVPIPSLVSETSFHVGGTAIAPKFVAAFVLVLLVFVALEVFYKRTWLGIAMRGVAEDREVAALRGISPARISQLTFVIAGVVTALAAFAIAPIVSADVTVGLTYTLKGFIALAVGGFGSIRGCVVGGLVLGAAEQLFDLYVNSNYEVLAGLIIVLLVLTVRPAGLFGVRRARAV